MKKNVFVILGIVIALALSVLLWNRIRHLVMTAPAPKEHPWQYEQRPSAGGVFHPPQITLDNRSYELVQTGFRSVTDPILGGRHPILFVGLYESEDSSLALKIGVLRRFYAPKLRSMLMRQFVPPETILEEKIVGATVDTMNKIARGHDIIPEGAVLTYEFVNEGKKVYFYEKEKIFLLTEDIDIFSHYYNSFFWTVEGRQVLDSYLFQEASPGINYYSVESTK